MGPGLNSNSFIGSILHYEGFDIANFEPDPPNFIVDFNIAAFHLLGTTGNDVLLTDYNTSVLFGGLGADTLINNVAVHATLVAGRDYEVDILSGGTLRDTLVGYFNIEDIERSDVMSGGGGIDRFILIDPATALAGGIPGDPSAGSTPDIPYPPEQQLQQQGFTALSSGGFIDGGGDADTIDLSALPTGMVFGLGQISDIGTNLVVNVENLIGTNFDDELSGDDFANAMEGSGGNDVVIGASGEDILYGGAGDDHLSGGFEYDQLYDGAGKDILEGSDDDDYYLEEDNEADIIILGPELSYISGGDSLDRLVLRTDLIGLNPEFQDWTNPATGISDGVTGIPLLGGFITSSDELSTEAVYRSTAEQVVEEPYHLPEDPETYYDYRVADVGMGPWDEFISMDTQGLHPTYAGAFSVWYQKMITPWNTSALAIKVEYWKDGEETVSSIFVEGYEEGDFGIEFAPMSTFLTPEGDTLTYAGDQSHISYINKGGSYISIPEKLYEGEPPEPQMAMFRDGSHFVFPSRQDYFRGYDHDNDFFIPSVPSGPTGTHHNGEWSAPEAAYDDVQPQEEMAGFGHASAHRGLVPEPFDGLV